MAQKTTPEALALSARNFELANRNQHHHHLGPSGYYGKEEKFRKMEEEAAASGKLKLKGLKIQSRNWILGRSTDAFGSSLKFDNPTTEEAVSKILKYAEDKENCSFRPSRERDELSLALGNSKHSGRTRRLGKRMTWKYGFKEDQHMYKKHGRDRESNLELTVKALVVKALEEQGLSMEPRTVMAPSGELALVGSPPDVPSNQGSTKATTLIDPIWDPTSCTLVVLIDRQNTMMEVAKGVAHPPGGLHHYNKIPPDYIRVEVHSMKPEFMEWMIDHPTPEGLRLLEDVIN
jgi:hypothetical protein